MANTLTITSTLPLITPVYNKMEFSMVANYSVDYMALYVYIGDASKGKYEGDLRILELTSNVETVDIQGLIQPFFESDANEDPILKRIDVHGHSYLNDVDVSVYVNNYYVFNGVNQGNYSAGNYVLNGSVNTSKFLNNYNAPIDIHYNDTGNKLYFFTGNYANSTGAYTLPQVQLKVSKDGGTKRPYVTVSSTVPKIYALPIDIASLNSLIPTLGIDANTLYYTIDISKNTAGVNSQVVNIVPVDERYSPIRVQWIDQNGCINYFNFDLLQTNTVEIDKQSYLNNGTYKIFNTKVADIYTITTNWITEEQSLGLKDLWYSPSVMIDGKYALILTKSMKILNRREVKLINYTVEYQYASEYKVQVN